MNLRPGRFCDRIIEAGWLLAVAVVPAVFSVYTFRVFEPDKGYVVRGVTVVMVAAWLCKQAERAFCWLGGRQGWIDHVVPARPSRPRLCHILVILCALFGLVYVASTLLSIAPRASLLGSYQRGQGTFFSLCLIAVSLLIATHLRTKAQLGRLQAAVALGSLPVTLYAWLQHAGKDPLPWGPVDYPIASTMGNADFLAAYLAMVIPVTLAGVVAFALWAWRRRASRFVVLGGGGALLAGVFVLGLQIYALVLTRVPVACLVLLVAGVPCGVLSLSAIRGNRRWAGALPALAGVLILATFTVLAFWTYARVPQDLLAWLGEPSRSTTAETRQLIREGAQELLYRRPLLDARHDAWPWLRSLLGYGPETMHFVYDQVYQPELARYEPRTASPDRAFNQLLDVGVNLGWAGTVSFVMLVLAFCGAGVVVAMTAQRPERAVATIGFLGIGLVYLIESQFGVPTVSTRLLFWVGVGAMAALVTQGYGIAGGVSIRKRERSRQASFGIGDASLLGRGQGTRQARLDVRDASPLGRGQGTRQARLDVGDASLLGRGQGAESPLSVERAVTAVVPVTLLLVVAVTSLLAQYLASLVIVSLGLLLAAASAALHALNRSPQPEGQPGRRQRLYPALACVLAVLTLVLLVGTGLAASRALRSYGGTGAGFFVQRVMRMWTLSEQLDGIKLLFVLYGAIVLVGLLAVAIALPQAGGRKEMQGRARLAWAAVAPACILIGVGAAVLVPHTCIRPAQADAVYKQAQPYERQRLWDMGILVHQEAVRLAPGQAFYYIHLGRALLEKAKLAEGADRTPWSLRRPDLAQVTPQQLPQLSRADLLYYAEAALLRAYELNPLHADHAANLARLYRNCSELATDPAQRDVYHAKSLLRYAEAVTLSPNKVYLYDEWGLVYRAMGDRESAIEAFERALALDDGYDVAYMSLGDTYLEAGQLVEAKEVYLRAVEVNPDLVDVRSVLAYIYGEQGDYQAAIAETQKVLALAQSDEQRLTSHKNLAVYYTQAGELDEALQAAQEALKLAPQGERESLEAWIAQLEAGEAGPEGWVPDGGGSELPGQPVNLGFEGD